MEPILVKNPCNNRYYNIAPLFEILEDEEDFHVVANDLERAGEMIGFLIKDPDFPENDIKDASHTINQLKRILRKIKKIE